MLTKVGMVKGKETSEKKKRKLENGISNIYLLIMKKRENKLRINDGVLDSSMSHSGNTS